MKKIFLLVTLLCSMGMQAQEAQVADVTSATAEAGAVATDVAAATVDAAAAVASAAADSLKEQAGELDPWYLDALVEVNHSMNENLDRAFAHRFGLNGQSLVGGLSVYFGREWLPILGWRVGLGYDVNTGRATFFNKDPEIYHFHDMELFGDLTLDLMDLFAPNRKKRMFGLKAMLGAGGLVTFGFTQDVLSHTDDYSTRPRLNWGIRAGLATRFRISERFALGADLLVYGLDDHFNGVAANFPLDMRVNLGIKATWLFPEPEPEPEQIFEPLKPFHISVDPAINDILKAPIVHVLVAFKTPANLGTKHRTLEGQTFLDFPVNRTEIYPTYRDNPAKLREIVESIDVVKLDKTVTIDTIWIHGFASPEGTYKNNIRLAQGRAESLKKYLMDTYHFKSNMIRVTSTPEDWPGLRRYIEDSCQLPIKDKLFAIMDNPKFTPDKREAELKKALGAKEYNHILTTVYPALRHSDYKVAYTIRDYTLEEAQQLITRDPTKLSTLEMHRVAMSYPQGSFKQIEALSIAAGLYPDNQEINLNLVNALLVAGELEIAEFYLPKAGDLPEAIHARGVLEALRKNYEEAEKYLKRALELGVEASASVISYPDKE